MSFEQPVCMQSFLVLAVIAGVLMCNLWEGTTMYHTCNIGQLLVCPRWARTTYLDCNLD